MNNINEKGILTNLSFPRLTKPQCKKVHAASLEILEKMGVQLHLKEAVDLIKKAGARVTDDGRVFIPHKLVEQALKTAPKQVILYDRNGEPVMPVSNQRCFYGTGSDCLNIIDHRTGKRREAKLGDVKEGVILCDSLSNIDFVMSMVMPSDVNTSIADRYQMELMLSHTTKPIIMVSYEYEGCLDCVEMAEAVAGGEKQLQQHPNIGCYINVVSGFIHNKDALQKLLFLSSKNLPSLYIPSSTAGVTSPMTPAGSLALDYAGVLAGLVLSQLKREGAPFIVPGMPPGQLDMRTMVSTYAEPERGHSQALAHFYDLPMFSLGGASDAKTIDQQAAAEAALTLLTETLGGGNIIHDLGYLESGLTFSFQQLVLCTEIVSWIKGFTCGFKVDENTLALDVIAAAGPEGQFLDKKHTRKYYRERWYPELFERKTFEAWDKAGAKNLKERAAIKVDKYLAEHKSEPLPEKVKKQLRKIVKRIENKAG